MVSWEAGRGVVMLRIKKGRKQGRQLPPNSGKHLGAPGALALEVSELRGNLRGRASRRRVSVLMLVELAGRTVSQAQYTGLTGSCSHFQRRKIKVTWE